MYTCTVVSTSWALQIAYKVWSRPLTAHPLLLRQPLSLIFKPGLSLDGIRDHLPCRWDHIDIATISFRCRPFPRDSPEFRWCKRAQAGMQFILPFTSSPNVASKQTFVLDHRSHPTKSLYHPDLADTQGPALLAFNDAEFTETDWKHIRSIQNSSKKTDTS